MAKQLFNSSEKSNFILNMTEEKYSKIASFGLLAACLCTSLSTAVPVISGNKVYTIISAGLSVAGVICMVLALIGVIKRFVGKKMLIPLCGLSFSLVWAVISLVNSYDRYVSLNGYPGRGEGLLAIIFYTSFFITAASIKIDKTRKILVYGILANGLLNCVFAVIQVFWGKFTDFKWVSVRIELHAAAGLSQSPLFLAMVLSLSIAAALMGAILFSGKKEKNFCICSACVFSFVIMFTYSFIGICGTILSVAAAVITVFFVKAPKINLLLILSVILPAAAAIIVVNAGIIGNVKGYRLYDGRILWFADSYTRINTSGNFDSDLVDIDDTYDVYYTLNRKTLDIISGCPLTGTGPDQLIYPQIYTYGPAGSESSLIEDILIFNKGTFDKVYNEYLNTAATRGIPSVAALIAVLTGVITIGFKGYRKSKNPMTLCMTLLTSMGALLFLIGCSNTAFSPIFWVISGASVSLVDKSEK